MLSVLQKCDAEFQSKSRTISSIWIWK